MNALEQAARMALDTLERLQGGCTDSDDGTVEAITVWCPEVIDALRAALDAGQAQPVAWLCKLAQEDGTVKTMFVDQDPYGLRFNDIGEPSPFRVTPLYASPPARQPLTDEQIAEATGSRRDTTSWLIVEGITRAIERAHGIGATP